MTHEEMLQFLSCLLQNLSAMPEDVMASPQLFPTLDVTVSTSTWVYEPSPPLLKVTGDSAGPWVSMAMEISPFPFS